MFLSDARQPEVRFDPFKFALTLSNLYCLMSLLLLLIEMICPKRWPKPLLKNPLHVDFRLSSITTLLLDMGVNSVNYF